MEQIFFYCTKPTLFNSKYRLTLAGLDIDCIYEWRLALNFWIEKLPADWSYKQQWNNRALQQTEYDSVQQTDVLQKLGKNVQNEEFG